MRYFLVTRRDGSFGVPVLDLLQTKRWRDIRKSHISGDLTVVVRCDYNSKQLYYTREHTFTRGSELVRIISTYAKYNVYRYGVDPVKKLVDLDIVLRG